jgi:hypothetical protein
MGFFIFIDVFLSHSFTKSLTQISIDMRKTLTIGWTLAMLVLIFFFLKHFFTSDIPRLTVPEIEESTEIFSKQTLDSLLSHQEYVLLTIGYGDCGMCDVFRLDKTPDKFPVGRYYIDANYDPQNKLVMQSLGLTGFPLSYVIDRDYNVIGIIAGLSRLEKRLDSVIYGRHKLMPAIPDMSKGKTHSSLSKSFKALLACLERDHEKMKAYAEASLREERSLFSEYLLFKYFEGVGLSDSVEHYRNRIVSGISHLDAIVYENLLTEIAPDNHVLHNTHNHE